jgi:hypothetical protein
MADDYGNNDNSGNNDSNQSSNSGDNYQQMPDEQPPAALIVAVPDLAPLPEPVFRIDDPGYVAPPPESRRLRITSSESHDPITSFPPDEDPGEPPTNEPQPPYMPTLPLPEPDPGDGGGGSGPVEPEPAPQPWTPSYEGEIPPWHRPSGAPMDEGFYVWLSHHGVTPGDPSKAYRMAEFKSNYLSMPQAAHDEFIKYGREHPEQHQFDLSGWKDIADLPTWSGPRTLPGIPEDPPYTPPPEDPRAQPTPMPILPLPGEEYRAHDTGTGDLDDLGLRRARPTEYDWQGRRLGRRVWDARLGRYV